MDRAKSGYDSRESPEKLCSCRVLSRFDSGWPAASPSLLGYNLLLGFLGLDDRHDGHSMEAALID